MATALSVWEADWTVAWGSDPAQPAVRVLLVEDDEDDYLFTRDLLGEIGKRRYALDRAATFEDAVEALGRREYDVCLVDYRLGGRNGLELLAEADGEGPPVILLTGLDDWDVDIQAAQAGAADYLVKGQIDAPLLERSIRYAIERKRTEEALKEADRRKDEFLAMLGHELRNPLAAVRNGLNVLLLSKNNEAVFAQAMELMEKQTTNLTRMVDDLLDVSRITRGKIQLRKEKIALTTVVNHAVESARPLIESQNHKLTVALPKESIFLEADPTRLEQVLVNLLNNAAKYTKQGGSITLTAERQGEEAVIRVRDNGLGIPAEMLPKIFDLFTQVERNLDRSQGGLGIGLTLVKKLVEIHGGRIAVYSEGVNKGSEFVVRLPILATEWKEPKAPSASSSRAKEKLRILVVEDSRDVAQSLKMLLELWGHDVRLAFDGPAALTAFRTCQPDVALIDIGLPGMNGYEVARQLRMEQGLNKPLFMAVTGYGQDDDKQRSQKAGFDYHMTKPVDLEKLKSLLASAPARL